MAKIENTTAYPTVTPAADDLLIGTDVNNSNETVTFKISDIVGAGGVAQDLQSVLDTGHTATKPIVLTGASGNISCTDIYPVTLTALGTTGNPNQILSSTGGGLLWIDQPTVTCCGIQDVLTVDNSTTVGMQINGAVLGVSNAGGGIAITTPATLTNSGTSTFTNTVNINGTTLSLNATSQINDKTGVPGASGQFLISQGAGAGVLWSSTLPSAAMPTLQEVLGAGNTSLNQGMIFTGTSTINLAAGVTISSLGNNEYQGHNNFTATGNTPSTAAIKFDTNATLWAGSPGSIGTAGQVLTATGSGVSWAAPTVANNTLQEVLDAGNTATQNITLTGFIRPTTIQDSAGGTGAVGQVLTSDGAGNINWAAAGTGAVASVTLAGAAVSTGAALTIAPTTGAVVVTPNAFAGSSNVGHVPTSAAVAQTTHFLRADGSWQIPAQNNPHGVDNFKFYSKIASYSAGTYYTLSKLTSIPSPNQINTQVNPAAPMNYTEEVAGTIFVNPGACSGVNDLVMCEGKVQIGANQAATYTIRLWKIELCGGVAATQAGYVDLALGGAGMVCGNITWISTALKTLEPGYGFFFTFESNLPFASGLSFVINLSLRW